MTLLIITPDYASHAAPMLTIGEAWQRRGQRVVVATGPAMAPLVRAAGMEHTELIMSRGSNAGVIRTQRAADEEARSLEAFFVATRGGIDHGVALPGSTAVDRPSVATGAGCAPNDAHHRCPRP